MGTIYSTTELVNALTSSPLLFLTREATPDRIHRAVTEELTQYGRDHIEARLTYDQSTNADLCRRYQALARAVVAFIGPDRLQPAGVAVR
ncbi:hypothetical protein [Streptomyces sp. NPDC001205]